jgi:hypothetical protein
VKMDVGRAAVTTGEGGAPFYRGEAVGMRTVGHQLGRRPLMAPVSGFLNGKLKRWGGEVVGWQ